VQIMKQLIRLGFGKGSAFAEQQRSKIKYQATRNGGYLAQEHLNEFGLINLNARLYDPVLGRFLEMDPYVQAHDFTQSFNRYSYGLNNPLKYIDPSGENWWHWLLGDILTGGALSMTATLTVVSNTSIVYSSAIAYTPIAAMAGLWDEGGGRVQDGWAQIKKRVGNVWEIANGQFQTDTDLSFGQRVWQLVSRHSWEQPFTGIGYSVANVNNFFYRADVDYFHGATVTQSGMMSGTEGMTLGSNIMLSRDGSIDYSNTTLLHEYGHYLQVRSWGGGAMLPMSLSSLVSTKSLGWRSTGSHQDTWAEMDANARSLAYFEDRLNKEQRNAFTDEFKNRGYYDGRFYRSYIFPGLLSYLLYDITWSK
jgi:RHS repeat-associated protein